MCLWISVMLSGRLSRSSSQARTSLSDILSSSSRRRCKRPERRSSTPRALFSSGIRFCCMGMGAVSDPIRRSDGTSPRSLLQGGRFVCWRIKTGWMGWKWARCGWLRARMRRLASPRLYGLRLTNGTMPLRLPTKLLVPFNGALEREHVAVDMKWCAPDRTLKWRGTPAEIARTRALLDEIGEPEVKQHCALCKVNLLSVRNLAVTLCFPPASAITDHWPAARTPPPPPAGLRSPPPPRW